MGITSGMENYVGQIDKMSREIADLRWACRQALEHVTELREAWRTGAIREHDSLGGTRSNRNAEVEAALVRALAT